MGKIYYTGSLTPSTGGGGGGTIKLAVPDYSQKINMGLPDRPTTATTDSYTCPSDGFIFVNAARGNTTGMSFFVQVNGEKGLSTAALKANQDFTVMFPVEKDDVVQLLTDGSSQNWTIQTQQFYPLLIS